MTKVKRELLRDDVNGKIAGVCAGIADYFGWEVWLVRIVAVSAFFLGASALVLVLYIAAWVILGKKSLAGFNDNTGNRDNYQDRPVELKTRIWQRGESPKDAIIHLNRQFAHLESRLQDMERHVTSSRFQLNREFRKL